MHHIPLNSLQQELESHDFYFILSHTPQSTPIPLTKKTLSILSSSLSNPKTSLPRVYCIALIYLLSNETTNNNPEIATILYLLLEKLQGALITAQIRLFLTNFLRMQADQEGYQEIVEALDDSVLGVSKALLLNEISLEEVPFENLEKKKDIPHNIIQFLDFLCTARSLEEQALLMLKYASKIFETLLKPGIKSSNGFFHDQSQSHSLLNQKELFLALHKYLDTAVLQTKYSILIPDELFPLEKNTFFEIDSPLQVNPIKTEDFTKVTKPGFTITSFQDT